MSKNTDALFVAILDVNIGKPGPWRFDSFGAATVSQAWTQVKARLEYLEAEMERMDKEAQYDQEPDK